MKGELYLSSLEAYVTDLETPLLVQDGLNVKFNSVPNADYYLIHDSNDSRSEIRINDSEKVDGYLSYRPVAACKHDIYVTAHNSEKIYSPSTSNIIHNIEVEPVFFYDNFANEYYVKKDYFESKTDWLHYNHELYKNK